MDVSFPAFAQRVTVLGSTLNMVATSAGVSRGSASGVRAVMSGLLHQRAVCGGLLLPLDPPRSARHALPVWLGVASFEQSCLSGERRALVPGVSPSLPEPL